MRGQRGSVQIVIVFVAGLLLFAFAWEASFRASTLHTAQGVQRAQARALATAALAQAVHRLEQGLDPAMNQGPLLDGRAEVRVVQQPGGRRLFFVHAQVPGRTDEWIGSKLRVELRLKRVAGEFQIELLKREEVGA